MELIDEFIQNYNAEILIASFALAIISFLLVIINVIRTRQIIKKYKKLMRGMDNKSLEEMLINHLKNIENIENKIEEIIQNFSDIYKKLGNCIQKVGVIRYNPFDQMGSDQSFSIALLNEHNDGIVLTGLFTRDSSCVYAKPINYANSKYPLSNEEKQAIELALRNVKNR